MPTSIVPFDFEGHNVRVQIDDEGNLWLVLNDVC